MQTGYDQLIVVVIGYIASLNWFYDDIFYLYFLFTYIMFNNRCLMGGGLKIDYVLKMSS